MLGAGDGPPLGSPTRFTVGYQPLDVTIGDVDNDGSPDILTSNEEGDVTVLLGAGDGTFGPQGTRYVASLTTDTVKVADLNKRRRLA